MSETQRRAEAYVREHCPELMELSEGCVLSMSYKNMHHNEGGGEEWGEMEEQHTGIIFNSRLLSKDFEMTDYDNLTADDFKNGVYVVDEGSVEETRIEIIGHPIQLQHWLECIRQKVGRKVYMSLHTLEIEDSGFYMQFDKDTGQPATEADYQAFNQIVYGN